VITDDAPDPTSLIDGIARIDAGYRDLHWRVLPKNRDRH